jgi:large subunit ribosomal protein L1
LARYTSGGIMGKRIVAAQKSFDSSKLYKVEEAVSILKKNATAKFDETVELHIKLGVDPKQADQQVRGIVNLPHGTGKTKKIAVVAKGEKVKEAEDAGADKVGGEDFINEISKGKIEFDVLVATPDIMKDLSKVAKILGPRGLMPNPKSGTVTFELTNTIKELKAGRVEFKVDSLACIHLPVGKCSFSEENIAGNLKAVMASIVKAKPSSSKGNYLRTVTLSSTMGPGIKLDPNKF